MALNLDTPISIGIPFFNAEKYLIDAIRSIFCQTHNNWELILVDDGSTDNSLKLAKSINDKRVRVFSDGLSKGLSSRLNDITTLSKYSFIARMDADDLIEPSKFEKQIKILIDNPYIDLISTNSFSINKYDTLLGKGFKSHNDFSKNGLLHKKGHGIVHASIMGRKEWFLRNPYNNNIITGQDYDLWIRAAEKKDFKILILDEPLFYYREEMNVTFKKLNGAYKTKYNVQKRHSGKGNFYFLMRFKMKVLIIKILNNFNLLKLLLKRRTKPINEKENSIFYKNLAIIKGVKIPGIDF